MGSIGNTISSNIDSNFEKLPRSNIKPLKPTKLAKEIFDREYTDLRELADRLLDEGSLNAAGYSTMQSEGDPSFSKRMLQGMQYLINSEFHNLDIDRDLGLVESQEDKRRDRKRRYALIMLQKMLNKHYKYSYEFD